MNVTELSARRKRVFNAMEDGSVLLLFSGVPKVKSADEDYPFEVNHNFYYLTGIEQEDCVLMMVVNQGERKEYLFVPPFDPVKAKWYGKRLSLEEANSISGIRNVLVNHSLEGRVRGELSGSFSDFGTVDKLYVDQDAELKIAEATTTVDYAHRLVEAFPGLTLLDARSLLVPLRLKKSKAEIEEFEKAAETTRLGIQAMMAAARPGKKEYEIANVFFHAINDYNGNNGLSFPSIVASGKNACTLHYPHPNGTLKDGDLLLVDVGARSSYYCGDVSRTFPVSGRFTPIQRTIYEIVLGANREIQKMARPGVTIPELQSLAIHYMAAECVDKGLLENPDQIKDVYYHSCSHFIGLDTHDVGERNAPLQEGNVISNEPGLYFENLGIGVRIEDDLLMTRNGCVNLTESIVKDPDALEVLLNSGR